MRAKIVQVADEIGHLARQLGVVITTVESCTGGLVAGAITDVPGSSAWFKRGFITYANEAKHDMVGVSIDSLEHHGAVSRSVVEQMAQGGCWHSGAELAVAVSGVAGPGGGSVEKPVGTVWIAWGNSQQVYAHQFFFEGNRESIRQSSVLAALKGLRSWLVLALQDETEIVAVMKEKYDTTLQ